MWRRSVRKTECYVRTQRTMSNSFSRSKQNVKRDKKSYKKRRASRFWSERFSLNERSANRGTCGNVEQSG